MRTFLIICVKCKDHSIARNVACVHPPSPLFCKGSRRMYTVYQKRCHDTQTLIGSRILLVSYRVLYLFTHHYFSLLYRPFLLASSEIGGVAPELNDIRHQSCDHSLHGFVELLTDTFLRTWKMDQLHCTISRDNE